MSEQKVPAVAGRVEQPVRPWERCKEHGPAKPRVWACPACLVELREENQRLRMDLENTRAEAVLAVATERKRWRELLRTPHSMAGGCPDEVAGHDSRDLDCPACRLMSELGA